MRRIALTTMVVLRIGKSSASPRLIPKSCARPPGPRSVKMTFGGESMGTNDF